jgi:hypothetical protein
VTRRTRLRQIGIYVVLDLLCAAVGMGVPFFCIAFGFLVGWRTVRMFDLAGRSIGDALARILLGAGVTSGVTFAIMAAVWGRCLPMLLDPSADIANFGMPLILFEPRASFLGWIVLMIVVSPVLQFLVTVFGAHVALLRDVRARMPGTM